MEFKDALWDGSDPLYAPCLSWSGSNPARKYPRWRCPRKYLIAGYSIASEKIDPPGWEDDEHRTARALKCRHLTQEVLRWYKSLDTPLIKPDTWKWLIERYKSDEYSPIPTRANTRENYLWLLNRWEVAIGHLDISALTYEEIMSIKKAMEKNGRSVSYIKRMFTMLRTVAKYGGIIRSRAAREVSFILADIRFKKPPPRQTAPTREQVYEVVAAADADSAYDFALGICLQFELMLRAVDVRGHWLAGEETTGGIHRNGKRWQDGLTWDMFKNDLSGFQKVISKTRKTMTEPYFFDLTPLPDIRKRLEFLAQRTRVGPVILNRRGGLPYTIFGWSQAWARYRKIAGIPSNIFMMDIRSAAVTEAKLLSVDPYALRDAAQHANIATTDGYARGRSISANKVVKLRQEKAKK